MPIIRTTEGPGKIPSEDTLVDSGGEDGQMSVWHQMRARTQHAPSFGVIRTSVRLHLRNQPMYLPTVSFRVLPSYVLWACFIMSTSFVGNFSYAKLFWKSSHKVKSFPNPKLLKSRRSRLSEPSNSTLFKHWPSSIYDTYESKFSLLCGIRLRKNL